MSAHGGRTASAAQAPIRSIILFVLALALAAIGALAWKELEGLQSARSGVRGELQMQTLSLGALLETSFESAEQTMNGVVNRVEYDPEQQGAPLDLRKRLLRAPSLSDLRVYAANGHLRERVGLAPSTDELLPAWVQQALQQGRNTGYGQVQGDMAFFRTARTAQGSLLGAVYVTLATDYFRSLTAHSLLSDVTASCLVGPDASVMMDLGELGSSCRSNHSMQLLRQMDQAYGNFGTKVQAIDGHFIAVQPLRNLPLRVVQIAEDDLVLRRWRSTGLYSLVAAALVLLAAAMFIGFLRRSERRTQQLHNALHRMQLVIEQSPVPIVITDLHAAITYVNAAFCNDTGYPSAQLLGHNPRLLQSGQTERGTYQAMWQALTKGQPWRGILVNRRQDGSVFWDESFVAPLRNLSGEVTHYFAVKMDVSARILAEQKLLQAQAHLQASHDLLDRLSQHVPGVIFQYRLAPDGRSTMPYASVGLHALFGVAPQDVLEDAAPLFQRVHPDDLTGVQESIQRSGKTLSAWQHEFRIGGGPQGLRWLAGLANPMQLDDGSVLWHGFVKDITDRRLLEQVVYEHDRDLNTILENSSVGIIFVKGRMQIWANSRMAELFGYRMVDMVGQSTRMYYPSTEAYEALGREGYAAMGRGERFITEQPMRTQQGDLVWMRLSGKSVDQNNPDAGSIWVFEDVSAQKRLEAHLKLAASVFTSAREGILITDAKGRIVDVNATFCAITGYSRDEALGQNPRMLRSGRQPPEFYAHMWHSLNTQGHWYGEVWNRRKQGDVYAEMLTISSVLDAAGAVQNYVALFSDITPLKHHQQQLERIAHYDALTGLPNRVLLADRLHQAIVQSQRRKRCLAVVFLDLDGFKAVNDGHGHAAGDALLIALSNRLQAALRESDTLARIGGDEFVAILADLEHPHDCDPILARMLQSACEPVHIGAAELRVSASMGVTLYPQDGVEVDLLMRQADQAMYTAKQAGKNRYHLFDVTQDAAIRQQRENLERIQCGLRQSEFVLYYQPKVNMRSGTVVGAEALIRWNHPQRGLLQPAEFLPLIENHPFSIELGEWVIGTALSQLSQWRTGGLALPVSVNISSLQLQQDCFSQRMAELLAAQADVPASQLELEVLESSAFEDMARANTIIGQCQQLGLHFALDDFGTGYSSLTYLKHLQVETLKIDQSFVRDMLDDPNDLAIVTGIVGLARAFGRLVVAEGVETQTHRELLLEMGCDIAQGYGIAKPMPASEFPAWVQQWQAHGVLPQP